MITREERYLWGDEGEFLVYTTYDVYNEAPHADSLCYPLSVYGQQMLNDYIKLNDIKLKK